MQRLGLVLSALLLAALLTGCRTDGDINITTSTSVATSTTATDSTITTTTTATSDPENPPSTTPAVTPQKPPVTEPQPPTPEGTGRLTALVLTTEDNPRLAKDLAFAVDEDTRTATLHLDYQTYADLATLSAARLTATAEGGSAEFTQSAEDGGVNLMSAATCRITDANGWVKTYELIVNRKIYQLPIVNINLANNKSVNSIDR